MSNQPESRSPLESSIVAADQTGGFDQSPYSIRLGNAGQPDDGFVGFSEPRSWHAREEGEIQGPGFTIPINRVESSIVCDHEHGFGHLEPGLGPFGTDFEGDHRSARVVDYHEPGHGTSVATGWKVTDGPDGFYSLAIPLGPTVGVSTCVPEPGSVLRGAQPSRLRSVAPGESRSRSEGLCCFLENPPGSASGGLIWDQDRNANGLLATLLRVNPCADTINTGRDGTPNCILGIRADAHIEYDDDNHGPTLYRLTPDLTDAAEPQGTRYKAHMAPDRSIKPCPSSLVWRPWFTLPEVSEFPDTQEEGPSYTLPRSGTSGDSASGAPDRPTRLIEPVPGYEGPTGGPISPSTLEDHKQGALIGITQPAYDRVPSTQVVDGLLAYSAHSLHGSTGRVVSYTAQFDVHNATFEERPEWGYTLPGSNTQIGATSSEDPYIRFGAVSTNYHAVIKLDNTGGEWCFDVLDSTNTSEPNALPATFKPDTFFQAAVSIAGDFTQTGTTQKRAISAQVTTTDATETTCGTLATESDAAYVLNVMVIGIRTDGTVGDDVVGAKLGATVVNSGGTVSIQGGVTAYHEGNSDAGKTYDATIDISGTDIRVRVTGAAGETLQWRSEITATAVVAA